MSEAARDMQDLYRELVLDHSRNPRHFGPLENATHTADGIKVGIEQRRPNLPLVCLETALPAKFAETIVEAIGCEPARPAGYADIESRPQRVTVLPADVARLKAFVEAHAG